MNKILLVILLLLLLCLAVIICLGIGPTGISYGFLASTSDSQADLIIYHVRLPRILGALLIGLGLSACGSILQAILRNPLAEPYTLGISGGAALGVTLGLVISSIKLALPISAFLGAIISLLIIYLIASRHHFSVHSLILAGVILSFICSSLVLLIFSISKPTEIHSVMFFLMGNLSSINYYLLKIISLPILIGVVILTLFSRDIDALSLGDEKAIHLGVSAKRVRQLLFIVTSLITGCCVSAAGMVGFVGLMIPHIMRSIVGPKQGFLIISSVLSGGVFLIVCDTFARTIIAPAELPVGVITGIIGGVFFIGILLRGIKVPL
ncbi:MAG: iron ABC transporter permease [Planctomycetota bacterium]|nr:iron ABC transporter permease [Planctomycetota bacterium]MDI6787039.1 iron ABC transporter permease [Planctomycetota bacterium]